MNARQAPNEWVVTGIEPNGRSYCEKHEQPTIEEAVQAFLILHPGAQITRRERNEFKPRK